MSVAAVGPMAVVVDGDALIAKAKKILERDRGFTQAEQQECRDGLYRLMERGDRVAHGTLMLICAEIEGRSAERTMNSTIAASTAAINRLVEHQRRRPERWAALSPIQRAAFLMDDGTVLGRAFARFAALIGDETTAQLAPPAIFEQERDL